MMLFNVVAVFLNAKCSPIIKETRANLAKLNKLRF